MLRLPLTVAAVISVTSTLAYADCETKIKGFDKATSADTSLADATSATLRQNLRQLRAAAITLKSMKKEDACEEVVEAIRDEIAAAKEKAAEIRERRQRRRELLNKLVATQRLSSLTGAIRAQELIGLNVRNLRDDDLGEVEDVVIATRPDHRSYVVLAHGGVLGIGETMIAVPIESLRINEDRDILILNATEKQFETAPSFKKGNFSDLARPSWRADSDAYFKKIE